jgi:quinoprotein glucose dehydrogenase
MAWILQMFDINPAEHTMTFKDAGPKLYRQNCMSCHGADRKGGGNNYPSIIDINKKLNKDQFISFINAGRRMMPSFQHLPELDKEAIAYYVLNLTSEANHKYESKLSAIDSFRILPYEISGYNKFYTKSGAPGLSPPWGVLNAIDLNSSDYVWKNVFGENQFPGAPPNTGCENYGGPVVTKGGLLFIGATKDGMFRAYNKRTGKLLWQTKLPAAAFATPATYEINGKQYVVIACGGGKLGTQSGDSYVAFALPQP